MARATARRIIVADSPEELEALTAAAGQNPAPRPAPDPIPPQPDVNPDVDDDPDNVNEDVDDDDDINDPDGDGIVEDDDPDTVREDPRTDDPDPDAPEEVHALQAHNDLRRQLYGEQRKPAKPAHPPGLDGEILDRPMQSYEARITIVEAWQYPGSVVSAPAWIDRNWVGYADFDAIRAIEPGPCLRVPSATGEVTLCRIGDYVAQQEVKLDGDLSTIRIEVWAKENFHKLFIPKVAA